MREKMFLYSLTWRYDFALIKDNGYNEAMYDEEDASTISLILTSNFILLVFFSTYISEFTNVASNVFCSLARVPRPAGMTPALPNLARSARSTCSRC